MAGTPKSAFTTGMNASVWAGSIRQPRPAARPGGVLTGTHISAGPSLSAVTAPWKTVNRIERLGARFEGVLRQWSPSRAPGEDGRLRDSAMFSVLAAEWPAVKAALRGRLAANAASGAAPGPS